VLTQKTENQKYIFKRNKRKLKTIILKTINKTKNNEYNRKRRNKLEGLMIEDNIQSLKDV
jgi:hypothetical protein